MADRTLIVSIVGIVTSGVVGPTVTTWAARVSQRRQFVRDREGKRREDLLELLDEAASVLGLGLVRLRQTREADLAGASVADDNRQWAEQVFALGQRLELRLGTGHEAVTAYSTARERLVEAAGIHPSKSDSGCYETALLRFEAARTQFLDTARRILDAPVSDKEPLT